MAKNIDDMTLEELRKAVKDKVTEYLRHGHTDTSGDWSATPAAYKEAIALEEDKIVDECLEIIRRPFRKPVAPVPVVTKRRNATLVSCPVCGHPCRHDRLLPMSVSNMLSRLIAFAGEHQEET